jgi:hypothetical protein
MTDLKAGARVRIVRVRSKWDQKYEGRIATIARIGTNHIWVSIDNDMVPCNKVAEVEEVPDGE